MKKALVLAAFILGALGLQAQTAIGLQGWSVGGLSVKHFLDDNTAVQGMIGSAVMTNNTITGYNVLGVGARYMHYYERDRKWNKFSYAGVGLRSFSSDTQANFTQLPVAAGGGLDWVNQQGTWSWTFDLGLGLDVLNIGGGGLYLPLGVGLHYYLN